MARLNASNNAKSLLVSDVDNSETKFEVEDASGFPDAPFRLSLEDEIVEVTKVDGNTFTVKRAMEGTESSSHEEGTSAENRFTSGTYDELETREGAQDKSDDAEKAANEYTDEKLDEYSKDVSDDIDGLKEDLDEREKKDNLSSVATSGKYDDLSGKPDLNFAGKDDFDELSKAYEEHEDDDDNPHDVTSEQVINIEKIKGDESPDKYPEGISLFETNSEDDGYPTKYSVVQTNKISNSRIFQICFTSSSGAGHSMYGWYRQYDADDWSDWTKIASEEDLKDHVDDGDIHFKKTDVSKEDVGLSNVTNDKQVTEDGIISNYLEPMESMFNTNLDAHKGEIASSSSLGHIKVGDNLSVDSDGTLNAEESVTDWDDIDNKPSDLESTSGAKDKADVALSDAKKYTDEEIDKIDIEVPDASTSKKGIVQLSSDTNSSSVIRAATPKAVKESTEGLINDDVLNEAIDGFIREYDIDFIDDLKPTSLSKIFVFNNSTAFVTATLRFDDDISGGEEIGKADKDVAAVDGGGLVATVRKGSSESTPVIVIIDELSNLSLLSKIEKGSMVQIIGLYKVDA